MERCFYEWVLDLFVLVPAHKSAYARDATYIPATGFTLFGLLTGSFKGHKTCLFTRKVHRTPLIQLRFLWNCCQRNCRGNYISFSLACFCILEHVSVGYNEWWVMKVYMWCSTDTSPLQARYWLTQCLREGSGGRHDFLSSYFTTLMKHLWITLRHY